jgi:hypothetical protein
LSWSPFRLNYLARVVGKIDLRRGFVSGAEYIAVAITTKLAPTKNDNVGWKSNKNADMIHEIIIEKDVAKTFKTLSAYWCMFDHIRKCNDKINLSTKRFHFQ